MSATATQQKMIPGLSITVKAIDLRNAVSRAAKVIKHQSTIPVLNGVHITARRGQGLTVVTTNMEVNLIERVSAEVHAEGEIVILAKPMAELLRLLPKGTHEITMQADLRTYTVTLTWADGTYTLHGYSADQFPSMAEMDRQGMATVPPANLRQMLDRVLWSVSKDESKPWLTGVRLRANPELLRLISTNGVTIARSEATLTGGVGEGDLIIPGDAIKHMANLCKRSREEQVILTWGKTDGGAVLVKLEAGDSQVITRTLEGAYPDIERLVPQEYPYAADIPRRQLIGSLKRLAVLAKDGTTRWTFWPDRAMQLEANTPEFGQAVERIHEAVAPGLEGEYSIAFNAAFWISVLSTWAAETIRFEFAGSRHPVRASAVGAEHPHDAVILPLITF